MTDPAKPALAENWLLMCKEDFNELFNHAAERGVRAVLAELGNDHEPVPPKRKGRGKA
mgnify:CR=1 FL=1